MKSKRSKACDIPLSVKKKVWKRDGEKCIVCWDREAMPNSHFISRAQGGLGIEENIVTLCSRCHKNFDQTVNRPEYRDFIRAYLKSKYPCWNEENLIYKKGENYGRERKK